MMAMPCMPPGALCALRGGVLVITEIARRRMACGWYSSETILAADAPSPARHKRRCSYTVNMSSARMRPSLPKPIFMRPSTLGRARPMKCSSSRLMRIITGAFSFFESSAGIIIVDPAGNLAAESAARVFADEHDVVALHIHPACAIAGTVWIGALRARVQEKLAVLPVGHGRPRLKALVAHVRSDKRFVQNQRGILEAGIDIAETSMSSGACPIGRLPLS